MKRKEVIYIISRVHKSLAFEWIVAGLKNDYKLTFILLNTTSSSLEDFLFAQSVEVKRFAYQGKKDFVPAFFKTLFFLLFRKPHVVHAHLFDAQLIGLTAAWFARIQKRIYTRHNSNYHHVYHPRGVKFDLWSNRMATKIISISQATDKTLMELEHVPLNKVVKIQHGFDLNVFAEVPPERTERIRTKWQIQKQHPIVGIIARHIEWKGIQFIIPAFQKFLNENPEACLVIVNASGPYHIIIKELLKLIPVDRRILIPFEEDVAALYSVFDMYVHTPVDSICEAFGQTYVEALAAGIPSIFTLSGIAAEFIQHNRNAVVVDFKDSEGIYQALKRLWMDKELRKHLVENGRQDVFSRFGMERMLMSLRKIYDE
jgi:glycosyltransferase involved in cell wall biosynthesis